MVANGHACSRSRRLVALALALGLPILLSAGGARAARSRRGVVLEGILRLGYADDFVRHRVHRVYSLTTAEGEVFTLNVDRTDVPEADGAQIRAVGSLEGHRLRVEAVEIVAEPQPRLQPLPVAAGVKNVAVILILFADSPIAPPFSREQASEYVFSGPGSTNALLREMSNGILSLGGKENPAGDIFGWYRISDVGSQDPTPSCADLEWAAEAEQLAAADGYDPTSYDHIIYAFPFTSRCGDYGGFALDHVHVFINGYLDQPGNTAHEIGHNYGLAHAQGLACTDRHGKRAALAAWRRCRVVEYGDPFDLMGAATYFNPRHVSAWAKVQLGWLPFTNVQTVTSDGIYTVAPSEQGLDGQTQVLRILRPHGQITFFDEFIYIEFRQPYGFDSFPPTDPVVNGVTIRIAADFGGYKEQTYLLDTEVGTDVFTDAPLLVGQVFYDPENDIAVRTLAVSPTGATVEIDVAPVEGKVGIVDSTLRFVAPPGHEDRVTVRQSGGYYVITDPGAPLADDDGPGGCEVTAHGARCPVEGITDVNIATGDQADVIRIKARIRAVVDAGAGNDRVYGGPGDDELDGGPGDDRLIGGPGKDTFFGNEGNDTIRSRDGVSEQVSCGPGKDSVYADTTDVLSDCVP